MDKMEILDTNKVKLPKNEDERFMLEAIKIAELGRGKTSPNPLVGAVLVLDGVMIGSGYHMKAGESHAEVNAIEKAGDKAFGSTLYVTLEPCAHQGRTQPCVNRIAQSGIKRIVVALSDPNPLVDGKGKKYLEQQGIEVDMGTCSELAAKQNEAYLKWITTGLPLVTLKMAMSLDGKIASRMGDSKWISSEESRERVHMMRGMSDAVMVGVRTVLVDDPRLTVRDVKGDLRNPIRIVVDSQARTPIESNVADTKDAPTLVAVAGRAPEDRVANLIGKGVEFLRVDNDGRVDLKSLLMILAKRGITSLLVEGGGEIAYSLLDERLIDKIVLFIAPRIIGGAEAPGLFGGKGVSKIADSFEVKIESVTRSGNDILVVAYPT